ncbi:hypothetical protein BH11ARM1_BH11ARM1_14660 [soil metagenome]
MVEAILRNDSPSEASERVETISWTVRLSDGEPKKIAIIGMTALTAGLAGIVLFHQILYGCLGFAIIMATSAEFWMGVKFKLDSTSASKRVGLSLSSIEWADVKRVMVNENAIQLSPLEEASRMDAFRGVVLLTTPENREEILNAVRLYTDHA